MTLEDLRTFAAVCEAGSLSAAAQSLKKSQPGVSQHVARLEAELDVALLERRARGVVPTAAGAALLEAALHTLAELALARRKIEALRAGRSGSLSIATGGTTLKHFMPKAVVRFRAKHPEVVVRFMQGRSSADCIDALRLGRVDLAFVTMQEDLVGLEQQPVMLMDYALLVDARHELARRSKVALADLRELELIGLPASSSGFNSLRRSLSARGVVPNVPTTVDDWDLCFVLVTLGLGSAIVPAFHAHALVRRQATVAAVPIDGPEPLEVGWAARRFASLSPAASAFMRFVDEDLRAIARPGVQMVDAAQEHVRTRDSSPRRTRRRRPEV